MHIPIKPNRHSTQVTIIRAKLVGDDTCIALGIIATGTSPIIGLCRQLVAAGFDPALAPRAYRGDTLCLIVRSIGEAAALEVNGHGSGFRPAKKGGRRRLVRKSHQTLIHLALHERIGGAP